MITAFSIKSNPYYKENDDFAGFSHENLDVIRLQPLRNSKRVGASCGNRSWLSIDLQKLVAEGETARKDANLSF